MGVVTCSATKPSGTTDRPEFAPAAATAVRRSQALEEAHTTTKRFHSACNFHAGYISTEVARCSERAATPEPLTENYEPSRRGHARGLLDSHSQFLLPSTPPREEIEERERRRQVEEAVFEGGEKTTGRDNTGASRFLKPATKHCTQPAKNSGQSPPMHKTCVHVHTGAVGKCGDDVGALQRST
ncbi:hypothetical protein HPB50_004603 [Hyalomma asiaticum]|uniref:Uncharacterized protein n=1 Tax=Hyalomma asiaticum TaxID=266040 RepID=A0ACB7TF20_HYAAI|nr:hypothetical protein HPB50_004603 [Hyalomma asiaticum]